MLARRRAMNGAVMRAARRDSEFVTGLAAERSWLGISKMMWIRWLAAADEACLLSNVAQMLPVAIPARCSNRGREAWDPGQTRTPIGARAAEVGAITESLIGVSAVHLLAALAEEPRRSIGHSL